MISIYSVEVKQYLQRYNLFNRIYILEKKDFKSIIITRGQQAFFYNGPGVNILGFGFLQLLNPAIAG